MPGDHVAMARDVLEMTGHVVADQGQRSDRDHAVHRRAGRRVRRPLSHDGEAGGLAERSPARRQHRRDDRGPRKPIHGRPRHA